MDLQNNDSSRSPLFTLAKEESRSNYTSPPPVLQPIMRNADFALNNLEKLWAEKAARNEAIAKTLSSGKTNNLKLERHDVSKSSTTDPSSSVNKKKLIPIIVIDDSDDDDGDSEHVSANNQLSGDKSMTELNKENQMVKENIEILNNELKELASSSKEIKDKLLGMKAEMSLTKNRNELKGKTTSAAPGAVPSKRLFSYDTPTPSYRATTREIFERNPPEQQINHDRYNVQLPPHEYTESTPHEYIEPQPQPINLLPHECVKPPPPPPPPPPPAIINVYPTQQQQPKPITNQVLPVKHSQQINAALKKIEQDVSSCIFNDNTDRPTIEQRSLARPVRLITVDEYTMPMTMIILNKEKDWKLPTRNFMLPAGIPLDAEMVDSWYESPFFVMLRRRAMKQSSISHTANAINAVIQSIPATDDLSSIKIGSFYFVSLEKALEKVRSYSYQHPQNEFFAALKLELSFYVHGNNTLFINDYNEIIAQLPLCIDVEWQLIRAQVTISSQLPLILDLLHRISLTRTSKESSSFTTQVLIRLLRLNGLQNVLGLLTTNEIDTEKAHIFDMDNAPGGLYLIEQDKYVVWMCILYYYVNKTLPETVCNNWMDGLVRDGTPTKYVPLFMIDWSTSHLVEQPLDRSTLFGTTNILLSMLRHFGHDVERKPLFVGIWRTLLNFLSHIPNYDDAGTLNLVRKNAIGIIKQVPETQEIVATLEIRAGNSIVKLVENMYAAKTLMSLSNIYSLSYNVALAYYQINPHNLLVTSNILRLPLLETITENFQIEFMRKLTEKELDGTLVDSIRQHYVNALGMSPFLVTDASRNEQETDRHRKIAFAWINLLLLTAISKLVYPETNHLVCKNLDIIFKEAMRQVGSEDGKLTIFKYVKVLI